MDDEGYFYFIDRIGDTFRWKGENVATQRGRRGALGGDRASREANVYGVAVPGHEGRAGHGRARGRTRSSTRRRSTRTSRRRAAARMRGPVFVRIGAEIEITGTFKHRKVDLVDAGLRPRAWSADPVLFADAAATELPAARPHAARTDRVGRGAA